MPTSYKLSDEKEWLNLYMQVAELAKNNGIFNVPCSYDKMWIDYDLKNTNQEDDNLFFQIKSKVEKYVKDGLIEVKRNNFLHPFKIRITIFRK
jgi:hypothetical protein